MNQIVPNDSGAVASEERTGAPLLAGRELARVYSTGGAGKRRRQLHALSGVSIEVARGEIVGVVGESGCGKSTLGRVLGGLVPPTSGSVEYLNEPVAELGRQERNAFRKAVQFVFQDPFSSLDPRIRIGDSILEGLSPAEYGGRAAIKDLLAHSLERVGLSPDVASRKPHEFSGGQRQRIGIARALVRSPQIIIADEPVAALDVSLQAQVLNLLTDLKEKDGLTLLFISHNLAVVGYLADRVVVMYLGTIVEEGPSHAVTTNPRHPYTRALLSAVPSMNPDAPEREVLKGELPSPLAPPSGCRFRTRCPIAQPICAEVAPELRVIDEQSVACHFA